MPIVFPQYTKLENARLQLVSGLLHAAVIAFIVNQFFISHQYARSFPLEGSVSVSSRGQQNLSKLHAVGKLKESEPFCRSPYLFDYWHDRSGSQKYEDHACLKLCTQGQSSNCLRQHDMAIVESPSSILAVTQVQEHTNHLGGPVHNYFVAFAEALEVIFTFSYGAPDSLWFQPSATQPQVKSWHSSGKDTYLLVLDSSGELHRVFSPGSKIKMSVGVLISLAAADTLDAIMPEAGPNHLPRATGASASGPIRRISGVELSVSIRCGDSSSVRTEIVPQNLRSQWQCNMRIYATSAGTWISTDMPRNITNLSNIRTGRGVRIKTQLEGRIFSIDPQTFFLNVAAAIVYLRLPGKVVLFVALYCCGHISTIYRSLLFRQFSISKEAGAMTMRLLAQEVAFDHLEGLGADTDGTGISREAFSSGLAHILERRGQTLDGVEMQQMISFCLETLSDEFSAAEDNTGRTFGIFCGGFASWVTAIKESFGVTRKKSSHQARSVDMDRYASACSSAEPMNFDSLVRLFDKDRSTSHLESFFMPLRLKKSLARARDTEARQVVKMTVKRCPSLKSHVTNVRSEVGKLESELSGNAASVAQLSEQVKLLHEQGAQFSQILISQEQMYKGVIEKLEERMTNLERHADAKLQNAKDFDGSWGGTLKTLPDMAMESQALETPVSHPKHSHQELKDMEGAIQQKLHLYEKRLDDFEATLTQLQQHLHSQLVVHQSQLSQVYMLLGNSLIDVDRRSARSGRMLSSESRANSRSNSRVLETDRAESADTHRSSYDSGMGHDSSLRHAKEAETVDSNSPQVGPTSAISPRDKPSRYCLQEIGVGAKPRMC